MGSSVKFIIIHIIFCYCAMLRFLHFLFFPKPIVIFCLPDVRLALFGCYRKEQTRGCREGKQFLNWDIRGAALREPSILVRMNPRILHSTVKVSKPKCIYKTEYCIDIFILSNSWRFWFFASYCTHLIWCLIVAMGAATGPRETSAQKHWPDVTQKDAHIHHHHEGEEVTTFSNELSTGNYIDKLKWLNGSRTPACGRSDEWDDLAAAHFQL